MSKQNFKTTSNRRREYPEAFVKEELYHLKVAGAYAVMYRKEPGMSRQWGLLAFGDTCPLMMYNITGNGWNDIEDQLPQYDELRFFTATNMEVDFIMEHRALVRMKAKALLYMNRCKVYEDSLWHRVADRLRRFFI